MVVHALALRRKEVLRFHSEISLYYHLVILHAGLRCFKSAHSSGNVHKVVNA